MPMKKRKLLLSISHLHKYYKWIWSFNAIIFTISAYSPNQVSTHSFHFTWFFEKSYTFFKWSWNRIAKFRCLFLRTKGKDLSIHVHYIISSDLKVWHAWLIRAAIGSVSEKKMHLSSKIIFAFCFTPNFLQIEFSNRLNGKPIFVLA